MMYSTVTLFITLTLSVGWGQAELVTLIPLLSTPPGFTLGGNLGAQIQIEAFLDILCPDSADGYVNLTRITQEYDPEDVRVVIQQFPLPYHRNAFIATQGFYLVEQEAPENLKAYMELMLQHTANYSTQNTRHLSENDIVSLIAEQQEPVTGISQAVFSESINNSTFRGETIYTWKYAARRGVAGTPWYFINGIEIAADPNLPVDFEMWKATLDSLLGIESPEEGNNGPPSIPDDSTDHHDEIPHHHDNIPHHHDTMPQQNEERNHPIYNAPDHGDTHDVFKSLNTAFKQVFEDKGVKSALNQPMPLEKSAVNIKGLAGVLSKQFRALQKKQP